MSCKKLSARARAEQDYYLQLDGNKLEPTYEERMEFLRYDSHGGDIAGSNPVLVAKAHYGMYVKSLRDSYFDLDGWPGGLEMLETCNRRLLLEAFGGETVSRWLQTREEKNPE